MRGVIRRHYYLWIHPEYFFDTFWQPVVDVLIWGFITRYFGRANLEMSRLMSFFLGGVVLFAVLRRGQHEITFSFMEEAWSRNLQNILMTPVGMGEYFTASLLFGLVKLAVELTLRGSLLGFLFGFNILSLGAALFPFALCLLLTGWMLGLFVNAAIIYFGRGLIALSWIVVFVLQPFACVFYPVAALPVWAQPFAKAFPATWVFEGMRSVLAGDGFSMKMFLVSLGMNLAYLAFAFGVFKWVMRVALDKGLLTKLEW